MNALLPIGTPVNHSGHGNGVIVAHNGVAPLPEKALTHFAELSPEAPGTALNVLASGMLAGLYSGDKFPYVVLFASGYQDVYSDYDITQGHQPPATA